MMWNKTGSSDLTNLPYIITTASLVDVGSSNWTETTDTADHPSMSITSDYGIEFKKTGFYKIDAGLFLYGTSPVSGTTGIISQNRFSTDQPDPTRAGYYPDPAPNPDIAYNRFDIALANAGVLGLDPDLNATVKVETAGTIVYLYVNISGTPSNQMVVRVGSATVKQSTVTVTRLGDL